MIDGPATPYALELRGLKKVFRNDLVKRDQVVLDNLSLGFKEGKCTGLLGHNGAGKTTTIRIVLGLVFPDRGRALIYGEPLSNKAKGRIGYMPETNKLVDGLTCREALYNQLRMFRRQNMTRAEVTKKVDETLKKTKLELHHDKRVGKLSKGMARRFAWAIATIHRPDLLILDEPFSSLDPLSRFQMQNWIEDEKQKGTSIILCTHELGQVHNLCDEFHVLNNGRLVLTTHQPKDPGDPLQASRDIFDWRHHYNIHISGADVDTLQKLGEDHNLLPWQAVKREGYLVILGFAEYTQASTWLELCLKHGFVIVRFGDESFIGEEEVRKYFEGDPS